MSATPATPERRLTPLEAAQPLNLPRLAAAIVTYNKREAVLALLARLRALGVPAFVTANACQDGTADAVRRQHPEASLLDSPSNLGGTGGFNAAVLAALSTGAPYLVLIDDDAMPEGDCLARLADFLDGHPDYAFAAPAIAISSRPDTLQETGGDVVFSRDVPVEAWNRFRVAPDLPPVLDIGYASACLLMVRSDAIVRLGVMDWDYFIFSDDVDWCLRLGRLAGRGACVTAARAVHDFPWAKPFAPMRLYYFQRNGLHFLSRWHTGDPWMISIRRTLLRLFRSWMTAQAAGDHEIAATLKRAFRDAWRGRLGRWQDPVAFPSSRREWTGDDFSARRIRRVLVNARIEDVIPDLVARLRKLGGDALEIDALCDPGREAALRERGLFGAVLTRGQGRLAMLAQFFALRRRRYDLVITDAFMEPRGSADMAGRFSGLYHAGSLLEATHRPARGLLAMLFAHTLAGGLAALAWPKFVWPRPEGRPPADARPLLDRLGIPAGVGQPWGRVARLPLGTPPDLSPAYGSVFFRRARAEAARMFGLTPEPYVPPVPAPPLGEGEEAGGYRAWCRAREEAAPRRYTIRHRGADPLFSVVVPVCDPPEDWLRECIDSVRSQTYAGWELVLADDASRAEPVRRTLADAARGDARIRVVLRPGRGGISAATNTAAGLARGTYLVFLDHDDILDVHALSAFAQALEAERGATAPIGVLYADEDRFDETRNRFWAAFKPAWSPDRLLATNYIHHPVAIRRGLFEAIGGLRSEYDGSQDHDLLLRASETGERVVHVPDVLYHMRVHPGSLAADPNAKPEAHVRDLAVIRAALQRRGVEGTVEPIKPFPGFNVIRRRPPQAASVSVLVVPAEGTPRDPQPADWPGCEVLQGRRDQPIPAAVNGLARAAGGDVLVIASSRIRPQAGWRDGLIPNVLRSEIGLVTGSIVRPDGRLWACGRVLGVRGTAGRWHRGCRADDAGYGGWMSLAHEVSAVPWTFCAVRKDVFLRARGFDEDFPGDGFDVDLSLRLATEYGLRNLALPEVRAILDSPGAADEDAPWSPGDLRRLWERWGAVIRAGDPCYNANLTLLSDHVIIADRREYEFRARGALEAWDAATADLLGARFGAAGVGAGREV